MGKCPFDNIGKVSYYVDHKGGTFYNETHNFAIVIPPEAVSYQQCIEIQATASRFGPYKLPDGCYPISSYFWVSANYTFEIPVYLILSHHADLRNVNDFKTLCALEACAEDSIVTVDGKLLMNKVLDDVYFDNTIGVCVVSTTRFSSICLMTSDVNLPDKFFASCYAYHCNHCLKVEICICHMNKECIEVCKTVICMSQNF